MGGSWGVGAGWGGFALRGAVRGMGGIGLWGCMGVRFHLSRLGDGLCCCGYF